MFILIGCSMIYPNKRQEGQRPFKSPSNWCTPVRSQFNRPHELYILQRPWLVTLAIKHYQHYKLHSNLADWGHHLISPLHHYCSRIISPSSHEISLEPLWLFSCSGRNPLQATGEEKEVCIHVIHPQHLRCRSGVKWPMAVPSARVESIHGVQTCVFTCGLASLHIPTMGFLTMCLEFARNGWPSHIFGNLPQGLLLAHMDLSEHSGNVANPNTLNISFGDNFYHHFMKQNLRIMKYSLCNITHEFMR